MSLEASSSASVEGALIFSSLCSMALEVRSTSDADVVGVIKPGAMVDKLLSTAVREVNGQDWVGRGRQKKILTSHSNLTCHYGKG